MEQTSQSNGSANKLVKKNSKKGIIFIILGVVILAGVAGIFYYKNKSDNRIVNQKPPKLFEKGDYAVEERADGKYIVVDKVGLTAKVPDGWKVEFEGDDMPDGTSQYWINLLSQDAEKTSGLLTKGCGISVLIGGNQDIQGVQNAIENLNDGMEKIQETRPDFIFNTIIVDTKKALESISPARKIFGKSIGVSIPIEESMIVFETRIPEEYEEVCLSVWGDFLEKIDLK